ncbi:MAG: sigma-70 family RNA polymerase sigma factor [Verrucomicrobiota bacterium]
MERITRQGNSFPKTRWSIVASVDDQDSSVKLRALEKLCRIYWPPLYGFARLKGKSKEDAEDLIQGYFSKLLSNESIRNASENRGKFRNFLLRGFENFIHDDWRKTQAQRRGGSSSKTFSIDGEKGEKAIDLPDDSLLTPEEAFDLGWAKVLLEQTLLRLRDRFEVRGKSNDFEAMLPFLGTSGEPNYRETAQKMGKTVESTRVYVQRFRAAYQECIREELADTLTDTADIETELRSLLAAFTKV